MPNPSGVKWVVPSGTVTYDVVQVAAAFVRGRAQAEERKGKGRLYAGSQWFCAAQYLDNECVKEACLLDRKKSGKAFWKQFSGVGDKVASDIVAYLERRGLSTAHHSRETDCRPAFGGHNTSIPRKDGERWPRIENIKGAKRFDETQTQAAAAAGGGGKAKGKKRAREDTSPARGKTKLAKQVGAGGKTELAKQVGNDLPPSEKGRRFKNLRARLPAKVSDEAIRLALRETDYHGGQAMLCLDPKEKYH